MQNRLVWAYLAAAVSIIVAELGSVVVLRIYKVEIDQMLLTQLMGIGTPSVFALFAFIRGIGNSQEIQQTAAKVEQHHAVVESQLAANTEMTAGTRQALERIERT